jgi:hypothetical protein
MSMRKPRRLILLVACVADVTSPTLTVAGHAQSASESGVETVVTFDSAGWTENICQGPDGSIYVTGLDDRVVWKIAPNAKVPQKLAVIPGVAHVSGIALTSDGFVVTGMERTFRRPGGADLSDVGPYVMLLDRAGKVTWVHHGEKGHVYNGVTPSGHGTFFIADTVASVIWEFDAARKQFDVWLKGERLKGANGIKLHNGWLYLSGGNDTPIQRIQMEHGRPKGAPIVVNKDAFADDFDIAKDVSIYYPTNTAIIKVSPSGELSTIREKVQGGPAALVSLDGKWLYWPTRFGERPQRLLRIAIQ